MKEPPGGVSSEPAGHALGRSRDAQLRAALGDGALLSDLGEDGWSSSMLMALSGHRNLRSPGIYVQPSTEAVAAALAEHDMTKGPLLSRTHRDASKACNRKASTSASRACSCSRVEPAP